MPWFENQISFCMEKHDLEIKSRKRTKRVVVLKSSFSICMSFLKLWAKI